MWEGCYGREPFDLRLTVLRLIRNLHKIIFVTLAGALLFGGGYYVKNVLLRGAPEYAVTSVYKLVYTDEPSKSGDYYINEMSWNTYVHSTDFLDAVWKHLEEATITYDSVYVTSREQLASMIEVKVASDIHIPSTIVTAYSPGWCVLVAQAVEKTMVSEFVQSNREISDIHVMTPAEDAVLVEPDVRPVRAFILSGILSAFFAVAVFLLRELSVDSIWLPATLRMRYGLVPVGTIKSRELESNLEYRFRGKKRVAVYAVDEKTDPVKVVEKLPGIAEWMAVPKSQAGSEPQASSESQILRSADACLLVVRAGSHAGKPLECLLEYFAAQDISVTAALLWEADEALLAAYYGWKKQKECGGANEG
ncbi:MAG: hypothetical protein NC094_08215 [Bacteroidales bacterium]|nr:hypothetical protein [Lachnoclostridium sp.]MCM1383121.1 hypothetical protein [Lachnoclostridium sp.]MCM1465387.1 hypothetical protein [Bacteroidales bacterium]